jgi:hypothetical protein
MFSSRWNTAIRLWRTVDGGIRKTTVLLWLLGSAMVILGVQGDERSWWSERPFLTNLVSSIAGACFGIPIALLVLQNLSSRQARILERHSTNRMGAKAAGRLLQSLQEIDQFVRRTTTDVDELAGLSRQILHSAGITLEPWGGGDFMLPRSLAWPEDREPSRHDLELVSAYLSILQAMASAGDKADPHWREARKQMLILTQHVHARFIASEREWPFDRQDDLLSRLSSDLKFDLRWFSYIKDNIDRLEKAVSGADKASIRTAMSSALAVVAHGQRFPSRIERFAGRHAEHIQAAHVVSATFDRIAPEERLEVAEIGQAG